MTIKFRCNKHDVDLDMSDCIGPEGLVAALFDEGNGQYELDLSRAICPRQQEFVDCSEQWDAFEDTAVENFARQRIADLDLLLLHFQQAGKPFTGTDALLADMLDDVIDVWLDDHLGGNDSCLQ
jgi:hypothetical protein